MRQDGVAAAVDARRVEGDARKVLVGCWQVLVGRRACVGGACVGKARKGQKGKKRTGNIPFEQRGAPRMRPPGHIPPALWKPLFTALEAAFFAVF